MCTQQKQDQVATGRAIALPLPSQMNGPILVLCILIAKKCILN